MSDRIATNRVPSLLRLHAHDPERQLFACDDRSLAFGFLCRPLAGGDDATEQRLRSFLALDWPTGTLLGFHLMASSAIHQLVQQMIALRAHETDPLLAMTIHDRAEHLLAGVDAPYPETGTLVRDFQLVVSVKLPQAGPQPTEPEMVAAHGHQRRARQALEDLQLLPKIMSAGDACFVLNQLLCRGPHATWRRSPIRPAVMPKRSMPGKLLTLSTASLVGPSQRPSRSTMRSRSESTACSASSRSSWMSMPGSLRQVACGPRHKSWLRTKQASPALMCFGSSCMSSSACRARR